MPKQPLKELPFPKREAGKLNIYFHVSENSGVGYYRQYLPALKLRQHGLANVMISDFRWGIGDHVEPSIEMLFDICNWADLIVVGRKDIPEFYAQWGGIRKFFNIPIVIDTDDNVRSVRPSNPGYEGYYPGAAAITWNNYGIAKVFDAVTVTTQDLKDFHKKENPNISILPNNIDFEWFNKFPDVRKNDGFIRMGFIGSAAHGEGMKLIQKPVIEILKKHKNVKFCITHFFLPYFNDPAIKDQIETIPWIPLEYWPKGLKEVSLDIGLAPLADNMFNRAKSNLRWMEYSAAHIPTIASPVSPYLCIENGVTGILVKEGAWFDEIEKLILDPVLRKSIADNAYAKILTSYNIDQNIGLWENTYKKIQKKYVDFFGAKKEFQKVDKNKYLPIKK